MKSNRKTKSVILIILGILFALSPIFINNLSFITGYSNISLDYSDDFVLDKDNLKISAISGKIRINNNSGWVDFRNAGNCTGNGTYSDPYVIEDLVIDGGGSGSCILIENSDVYFKIENCIVYKAEEIEVGIKLEMVSNGLLINNNIVDSTFNLHWTNHGISLGSCNNNTISGNSLTGNVECIVEENCDYNVIKKNYCLTGNELIILISLIRAGVVIGVATILLIRRTLKGKLKISKISIR